MFCSKIVIWFILSVFFAHRNVGEGDKKEQQQEEKREQEDASPKKENPETLKNETRKGEFLAAITDIQQTNAALSQDGSRANAQKAVDTVEAE